MGLVVGVALLGAPVFAADAVQPQMKQMLDEFKTYNPKPFHTVTPAEARKGPTPKDAVESLAVKQGKEAKPVPLAKVEDRQIPGPVKPIDVRVYTPEGTGPFPAVVYFHGGGFVVADLDVYDAGPRALAKQANAVVISAHYRLAPENPFPASHDDAVAAFKYVASHPKEFNIDGKNIAVAGESAGGNLATTVAMSQKQSKGVRFGVTVQGAEKELEHVRRTEHRAAFVVIHDKDSESTNPRLVQVRSLRPRPP